VQGVRAYSVRNGLCARLYITKIAEFGLAESLIAPPSGLLSTENAL
jgi:hypothetical protein